MQLASSRIWTPVAVSISYDDNHYTTVCHLTKSQTYLDKFPGAAFLQRGKPPAKKK